MSKELLAKLDEDLKLSGYAKRSRQSYVRSVRQLMNFWGCGLEEVEEQQVREYWLHCKDELDWSGATMRISYSGIKFFYQHTLKRDWETLRLLKVKRHVTPPTVMSIEEVRQVLEALPTPMNQTFYTAVYSLGLRLGEARHLTPAQVDSERMCVRIPEAKGGVTRSIPLPEGTLCTLRAWWKTHRNPDWIFPAPGRTGNEAPRATRPVSETTVQGALRRTVKRLKIAKHVHPHTFRHSYATHLLEAGVPIQHVQQCLGHRSLVTTMIYLHVTESGREQSREKLNQLVRGVLS
ncbi:MAG: site-specific integrase [Verrucomicrobia bacterium]|nr:site-specific integrase [Verrucomicrobiota bacterium]